MTDPVLPWQPLPSISTLRRLNAGLGQFMNIIYCS